MKINNHTDLLNALVSKFKLNSYLEIGINNPENNFNRIKAERRYGVDPNIISDFTAYADRIYPFESDQFFKSNNETFDLIFIDGLHHADQVQRDFENSLKCLNDGGFILIHDCLPEDESTTHVPRDSKVWHGDVYKFCMNIGQYDVSYQTFNIDNGCMLVWKSKPLADREPYQTDWASYMEHRQKAMNIVDYVEI